MSSVRSSPMCVLAAAFVTFGVRAPAQVRLTVDARASLAWWQVNPHLNHLWATTCPQEPSWRPGEGRSAGQIIGKGLPVAKQGYAAVSDTTVVPLYPRRTVRSVCAEAVEGDFVVADTVHWRGLRGVVIVKGDALITGEARRDHFARDAVLQTNRYPDIRFTIDSLVDVIREADTLRATVVGVFSLHGVTKAMTAPVRAWPEAGGLRVLARLRLPARSLVDEFKLSRFAIGLGLNSAIWQDLFMGVDVVLREKTSGGR
jgi:YceI-like protein